MILTNLVIHHETPGKRMLQKELVFWERLNADHYVSIVLKLLLLDLLLSLKCFKALKVEDDEKFLVNLGVVSDWERKKFEQIVLFRIPSSKMFVVEGSNMLASCIFTKGFAAHVLPQHLNLCLV